MIGTYDTAPLHIHGNRCCLSVPECHGKGIAATGKGKAIGDGIIDACGNVKRKATAIRCMGYHGKRLRSDILYLESHNQALLGG
ncbi:hypothetical protein [Thermogemmatispora carboxidivorans]|uniref:hypothetical protein n=1 Tax=Thermogemmatispora carboxidivorans TaxID=1382306 RepID=UPI0012DFB724|nr:hypothetical protein [Thermogemmatispora carboxidivorans]